MRFLSCLLWRRRSSITPPIPSWTLSEALENLASHNAKVADVLAREDMGVADMGEIHQYPCTMEQAVARIAASKDEIAGILEEVHLASEGGEVEALREKADAYLARTA